MISVLANYLVRVLVRLKPQRWCPPSVTLRLLRVSSTRGLRAASAGVRGHLPASGWSTRHDLSYAPGRDGLFDLVLPDSPGPHPWLLWAHGGGWHFGDKSYPLPYVELLATRGIAGVVINYPLAPHASYPAAPEAVAAAMAHVREHAAEYGLDPDRVVIAGDSAGAQVAAEYAAHNPAGLRGAVFFCGIFDPSGLDDSDRYFEAALESAMWSLSGRRAWKNAPATAAMNVVAQVGTDFPPTFLAAGNADPLTRRQTPPLAARLRELGVDLTEYFPGTPEHPVHHEFQFLLDTPEGAEALEQTVRFLRKVTAT